MTLLNAAQIHLALTHAPVVLSLTGLVFIGLAIVRKQPHLTQTAYWTFLVAGVICIPVFLTGEGTEEMVEHLPGVLKDNIEEHEEVAKLAMMACSVTGILALAGILLKEKVSKWVTPALLVASLITSALMLQTAHKGGLVRHTEIQNQAQGQINEDEGGSNDLHDDED